MKKFRTTSLIFKIILVACSAIILTACVTSPPYDYSALLERQPRSILVLPPTNDSIEVNAPYVFLSTITKPLAEKGYYVYPVAVIDAFLKENGLPTPVEMNSIPLDKIKEHIGADAVMYVNINNWGQKYQVLSSKAVVSASLRLIDVDTGILLWESNAYAEQASSNNNSGGLAGLLVAALVDQVVGSVVDHTPQLSRFANDNAINNGQNGLLNGPYKPLPVAGTK